jgi:PAS domain S-box-containing protein
MGRATREYDWARSSLGAPALWPQALKTLVELMLASTQPMFMMWGEQRIWLYNDAFTPILGRKHPGALGMPALEVWAEAQETLEPLFERVFAGEPVHRDDIELLLDRRGRLEEAHFAFSYNPARDENGVVAGLFGVCIETTERVMLERRQQAAIDCAGPCAKAGALTPSAQWDDDNPVTAPDLEYQHRVALGAVT